MNSGNSRLDKLCALALLGATSLAISTPARGKSNASVLVDDDAAVVMRIDPPALFRAADTLADMPGLVGGAVAVLRGTSTTVVGADLLTQRGYRRAGFDATRPLWAQVVAIDRAEAEIAFERLAGQAKWNPSFLRKTPRVMWRSRLFIPIRDRRRALKTLKQLLGSITEMVSTLDKNHDRIAMLLGSRTVGGQEILGALRGPVAVSAIGWLPGVDGYLVLRMTRRMATVELISTFAGVPIEWRRDRRKLLGSLSPLGRRTGGFSRDDGRGAKSNLRRSGIHLWAHSRHLLSVLRAMAWTEELRRGKSVPGRSATGVACLAVEELADHGAIRDVALSVEPGAAQWKLQLTWGTRRPLPWFSRLIRPSPAVVRDDTVASARLFVHDLTSLAGLRRPRPLRGAFSPALRTILTCPEASLSALMLTAWPELAGSFVGDLIGTSKTAQTVVRELGATIVAIHRVAGGERGGVAILESRIGTARPVVEELFATIFGKRAATADSATWGQGPIVAFSRSSPDRVGFALGERSLRWWLDGKGREASPQPAGVLATARGELPKVLAEAAASYPVLGPLSTLVERRFATASGTIRGAGDRISITVSMQVKK